MFTRKDLPSMMEKVEAAKPASLSEALKIEEKGNLDIYFAPHNLYISPQTRILIVGICPGRKQSEIALDTLAKTGDIQAAKKEARFFGQTRKNLLEMLEELPVEDILHHKPADLFDDLDSGLDTMALIPFPVFVSGKNYSGHTPALNKSELLQAYIEHWFTAELNRLPNLRLIIPLGKAVEQALEQLRKKSLLPARIEILKGFPHPSGLNTSRKKVFAANREQMSRTMLQIFEQPESLDSGEFEEFSPVT